MVNNILIFRTDRIGDLLYTCPALLTIKNNLSNAQITLIASKKNFAYAKSLQIFDKVDLFLVIKISLATNRGSLSLLTPKFS